MWALHLGLEISNLFSYHGLILRCLWNSTKNPGVFPNVPCRKKTYLQSGSKHTRTKDIMNFPVSAARNSERELTQQLGQSENPSLHRNNTGIFRQFHRIKVGYLEACYIYIYMYIYVLKCSIPHNCGVVSCPVGSERCPTALAMGNCAIANCQPLAVTWSQLSRFLALKTSPEATDNKWLGQQMRPPEDLRLLISPNPGSFKHFSMISCL